MVYYRKYRPQKISDLDSESVRKTLYALLGAQQIPHAFLFTGPKGLGKTSTARILAKAVNCERLVEKRIAFSSKKEKLNAKSPTPNASVEPCNECEQCISITNGSNMDVLEIDAASNRGIDEIRDLRDKVRLAPLSARKKVYIIDEVHMLTTEAFNALLKTVEEPPEHVLFILCTTEIHKVPATIVSRCFHVAFQRATKEELVHSFERIAHGEKLHVDKKSLEMIADMADGGFRDGAKIMEEIVLKAGEKEITPIVIEQVYQNASSLVVIAQLMEKILHKDLNSAVELIGKLTQDGADFKYTIEQLISAFHEELLIDIGVKEGVKKGSLTIDEIKTIIQLLTQANAELKYAILPQLPLELAIIEWSTNKTTSQTEPNRNKIQQSDASPSIVKDIGKKESLQDSVSLWKQLIDGVKAQNQSIAGVLRGSKLSGTSDTQFMIEAPYEFHRDKLKESQSMELLEGVLETITGKKTKIMVILKK